MRRFLLSQAILCLSMSNAALADTICDYKDNLIANQISQQESKVEEARNIIARIGSYTPDNASIKTVRTNDFLSLLRSINDVVYIEKSILQNAIEYKSIGCDKDNPEKTNKLIGFLNEKIQDDKRRISALEKTISTR